MYTFKRYRLSITEFWILRKLQDLLSPLSLAFLVQFIYEASFFSHTTILHIALFVQAIT